MDPLEYYSVVFKPAGEDYGQSLRRIGQAASEHGVRPLAEVVSGLRVRGEQIVQYPDVKPR